ncbi:class I SAM-dependent methyltransferase [Methanoregula sp.]|uniref:class I SAM-dependent methyltransferase n=1 Tax=Methanoregula sp. TaxID=2052170 RepID=UPI002B97B575|nr:RsmD family RNA methyltransferase [Methanoregula sp.]HVP97360.1 RsmD family RNA methyltransferase [Methanoregula sp.]
MRFADYLRSEIPAGTLRKFSGRYDVIGDIAIVTLSPALRSYDQVIAAAIIRHQHGIRTVVRKSANVTGTYRTVYYEIITGKSTETTHHENGFSYYLDLNTSFFNPRLSYERGRITRQVQTGERILVPFAGVGPFVIPAAARGAQVTAIEQNPEACRWLNRNIRDNRVSGQVTVIQGDAFDPHDLPGGSFERVIIPAPYNRDEILEVMAGLVRRDGIIHFYTFKNRAQAGMLEQEFKKTGYSVISRRRCGNVAPSVSRWVFDLRYRKPAGIGSPGDQNSLNTS